MSPNSWRQLKGVPLEQVAQQTTDNFFNLFKIDA